MSDSRHILILRFSALGDVAMTVPVIRVVAQTYPDLKLTICSKPFFKPLFKGLPNCHYLETDLYGEHKNFGLQKLAEEALAEGIDAVADLHNVLRTKAITAYLWWKGIPVARIDKGRKDKKSLVQAQGKPITALKSTHQRYADVFAELGFPIDLNDHKFPKPQQLLPPHYELISKQPKKIIGIAPFAAYPSKMYPLDQMEAVVAALNETNKYQLFLFGGGDSEIKLFESWEEKFGSVTSVAGKLSFEQELALISNIDGMLAMDSGNGHLAAAFGIPVLTLWGVTHPYAGFTPFQQPNSHQLISNRDQFPLIPTSIYGNKYPPHYENAMKSIPVELVIEKVEKLVR